MPTGISIDFTDADVHMTGRRDGCGSTVPQLEDGRDPPASGIVVPTVAGYLWDSRARQFPEHLIAKR
ncbi:hypothetical protein LRC484719_52570 [Mycobacterium riyadhense]